MCSTSHCWVCVTVWLCNALSMCCRCVQCVLSMNYCRSNITSCQTTSLVPSSHITATIDTDTAAAAAAVFSFCLAGLILWRWLQVRPVTWRSTKNNLWGLIVWDLLQAGCPSCHPKVKINSATPWRHICVGAHLPVFGRWARRWINHSVWCMASAMPDLQLPSQLAPVPDLYCLVIVGCPGY